MNSKNQLSWKKIKIKGRHFEDEDGCTVILRGVNLAGISVPNDPNGATHIKKNWPPEDLKSVSWVNRPFPLEEADIHFKRLQNYGFNCIRLLISWEAIEHEGPYQFDIEFLDYITEIIRIAGIWGFYVFINFHQDVWSRVTGGDGAPLWLFDKVGMDYLKFDVADCAFNMQYLWNSDLERNKYPGQSWGENTRMFPCSAMWTLFWGGNDFAPNLILLDEKSNENVNVREYMWRHFFACMREIAFRVKKFGNVIGFNPINEPSKGYIGLSVGKRILSIQHDADGNEIKPEPGVAYSPLDGMVIAAGFEREIEELGFSLFKGIAPKNKKILNKGEISIWKDEKLDFWRNLGVWDIVEGVPTALKEDHFQIVDGKKVDFTRDYLIPFHKRAAKTVRSINPDWIIFLENDPGLNGSVCLHDWPEDMPNNVVDAFHWYDLTQLGLKKFLWPINLDLLKMKPVFGMNGIQKMYRSQLKAHIEIAKKVNEGNCPLLVGEFGISMDMDNKRAYKKWKKIKNFQKDENINQIFAKHEKIMNLMYNAMDDLFLSSTHWNYASFNDNAFGDQWNLEDLSIFSKDQFPKELPANIVAKTKNVNKYAGSRGLRGFCRPFTPVIPGTPMKSSFNLKSREYILEFLPDETIKSPGIIFIPYLHYQNGFNIDCNENVWVDETDMNSNKEYLRIYATGKGKSRILITPKH